MLFDQEKKKHYARTFLLCFLSSLFLLECSLAARHVTQEVPQDQGSSGSEQGLIQQVTQSRSFINIEPKQELTNYTSFNRWETYRDQGPSSYIFKMFSWSSLTRTGKEKFESGVFEAGGQKWRMIIYPNGNKQAQATGYVSAYVALENPSSISGDIYAEVKFLIYSQDRRKYLMVQEVPMNRFNKLNSVAGTDRFFHLSTLAYDDCIFGVDIHVYDQPAKQQEILSMIKRPADGIFSYRILQFNPNQYIYKSADFVVGGRTWQLHVNPKGYAEYEGKCLSAFLYHVDYQMLRPKEEVFVRGKLRVLGRNSWQNVEKPFWTWFNATIKDWGRRDLLPLTNLNAYIVNGRLTVQVEIEEISKTQYLP